MMDPGWADFNVADVLRRLLQFYGYSHTGAIAKSERLGSRFALGKNFVVNAERPDAIPSQAHLHALSHVFHMTAGGAYRIFNAELDKLPKAEQEINSSRTRFIESYSFFRDRLVYVPLRFAPTIAFDRTSYLSRWIESWQHVPVRALSNRVWSPEQLIYARLSTGDDTAYPDIPRGATIQTVPVGAGEALDPNPDAYYLVQYGHGYLCTQPRIERNLLHLPARGNFYRGSRHLRLGTEAQVSTRATAFFVSLPIPPAKQPNGDIVHGPPARIVSPWEQSSLQNLIADELQRLGVTIKEGNDKGELIREKTGFGITGKHAREIRSGRHPLQTQSILGLTPLASLRFQDVLSSSGLAADDANRHALITLLRAHHPGELPNIYEDAPMPLPAETWSASRGLLRKWLMLLSHCFPDSLGPQSRWLYLHQSERYRGLDSLVRPGSLLLIRPLGGRHVPGILPEDNRRDWERPIYLVRLNNLLLCSYLYADAQSLTLVPHPARTVPPITVERSKAQIEGLVTGVFSLLA